MPLDIWGGLVTFEWVTTALVGIVVDRGARGIESGSLEESSDEDSASRGRAEREEPLGIQWESIYTTPRARPPATTGTTQV